MTWVGGGFGVKVAPSLATWANKSGNEVLLVLVRGVVPCSGGVAGAYIEKQGYANAIVGCVTSLELPKLEKYSTGIVTVQGVTDWANRLPPEKRDLATRVVAFFARL
jgi:hypothetical protein